MKLDFKTLRDKTTGLLRHKPSEYRTISAKAHHDWRIIIMLFAVLGVCIVAGNVMLFRKIASGEHFSTPIPIPSSRTQVSEKALQTTIDYYEAKAQKLGEIKTNPPNSSDPSL